MSLVALCADKGSPGVTTATVALGAVWPRRTLLAECDPSGGDISLRMRAATGQAPTPARGLVSYAASVRRSSAPVWDHVQTLEGGLEVLVGLQTAEQAAGLTGLWAGVAAGLAAVTEADVLADCGRVGPGTPALEVLQRADLVLLVTRSSIDAAVHLRDRVHALLPLLHRDGRVPDIGVLVVAPLRKDSAAAEVDAVLQQADLPVRVLGRLVEDPDGAAGLRGEASKRLDRSWLIRSAREVAQTLDARLTARKAA